MARRGTRQHSYFALCGLGAVGYLSPIHFSIGRQYHSSFIDRRFFRRKYDAAKTIAAFSDHVRGEVELDKLTGRLVEVVDETMQPAHVSLWLRNPGRQPNPMATRDSLR